MTRIPSPRALLLALLVGIVSLTACERKVDYPPRPDRAINDFAGLLAPPTVDRLEKLSQNLREQSGDAVVVATVETIAPETVEGYAVGLFEKWGIGEKGKDNGILILVAAKERETRIEVGYGLEGTIPDAEASRIIRDLMLPQFRQGDYNQGVELALQALVRRIARERDLEIEGLSPQAPPPPAGPSTPNSILPPLGFLLLLFLVLGLKIIAFRRRGTGSGGFWTGTGGGFGGGFGGGGFGGGFGGGMSGGGGASGGW
jgi:uncharacterized protein